MRFERLIVLNISHRSCGKIYWNCQCDCGSTLAVSGSNLTTKHTTSCGCWQSERQSEVITRVNFKHGHNAVKTLGKPTRTYKSWSSMKTRCYVSTHRDYHYYGGMGVTVCERWLHSFENFLEDMGERPDKMTIDRIDANGNYEPNNCRWATHKQQMRNKRNSLKMSEVEEIKASTNSGISLAKQFKVSESTISGIKRRDFNEIY